MTEGKPIHVLEDMDIASLTWVKLKTHMESRLQKLRADNDKDLEPTKTALLRGEIKAYRDFLALGKPQDPVMEADEG